MKPFRFLPAWLGFAALIAGPLGLLTGCSHPPPAELAAASATPPRPAAVEADPGGAKFTELAQASGLTYQWKIEGKRPLTILQTIGNGCAFLDYDNDGNLDVLLVGPKLALFRGDGKGHFTDVSAQVGLDKLKGHFLGCAVGDYDNDGFDDVYVSAYRGGLLLHNEGGKGFRDVTAEAGLKAQPWGTSCSFADVDNDGKLDLYVCNYVQFGPDTQPQLCEYSGNQSACGPRFYKPEMGVLYHNLGGGKFADITKAWGALAVSGKGLGVAAADFDGSGRQSLAIANDELAGDLLHNVGKKFVNIGANSSTAYDDNGGVHGGMGIDWGDYDNDGRLDLAVATFQHEAKAVYHNEGGNFFVESSAALGLADKTSPYVAFGIKFLDYDNDGWLDLTVANGHVQDNIAAIDRSATYKQSVQILHNRNGTGFEALGARAGAAFAMPIMGRGLAVGDYDNDGREDVLVVDGEGMPLLLHNETANAGHWLSCRLAGVKSNRDGIGALVTVEAGGRKMTRRCATDGSYLSASDRRVHVGLGDATSANVTVHWPSGATSVYKNLPADQVVTLREGGAQPITAVFATMSVNHTR